MKSAIAGALLGVVVVYLTGALVAWDVNPGEWGGFWRFWCICWAIVWGIGGAGTGAAIQDQR